MSWQAYVDDSLVKSGHVDKGAIFSASGEGAAWAKSAGFEVSPAELKEIVAALSGGSGVDKVRAEGLHVAGLRYVVTLAEGRSLYGRSGREGVVICKTTQAIIVAHYPETVIAGNSATTVEALADYLTGLGY